MAYVVGSVSVEVVPDFRNAQNKITAWFKSQPDSLKVPVRPDLDANSTQQVERDAKAMGDRVGKAMSEGAAQRINSTMGPAAREVEKLERDIERARKTEREATEALKLAELRLKEARDSGKRSAASILALEQAVEKQQRRLSESRLLAAESEDRLLDARQRAYAESVKAAEEATKKVADAERKLTERVKAEDEARERADQARFFKKQQAAEKDAEANARRVRQEVQDELREYERLSREQARLRAQQDADEIRARSQAQQEELRAQREHIKRLVKAENEALKEVEKRKIQLEIDEQKALKDGRHAGGLVVRAAREEIHQNAGLIAAAIGGALLLGAPLLSAAAITIFGGVATIAAAQSQEVRAAWLGTWQQIRDGATADARIIAPAYVRMAGSIADAFQDLRPEIRDAFTDLEPQLDVLSEALAETTRVTLPGFFSAIRTGMPVTIGFAELLTDTGQGLSNALDIVSEKAPASGRVLADLGDTFQELLPLIGKLSAEGAILANTVIPVLTTGFKGLNVATDLFGDNLPTIAAGFLAFRGVQGLSRGMGNLAAKFGMASISGGRFAGVAGRAAGALTSVSKALPVAGVVVGLYAGALADSEARVNSWSDALIHGGDAAAKATVEMAEQDRVVREATTGWRGFLANLAPGGNALNLVADETADARKQAEEYRDSLGPLARAQLDYQTAIENLQSVQDDASASSSDLAAAQAEVESASRAVAEAQRDLEMATTGVTEAMALQADQATQSINAEYARQKALDKAKEKQSEYNEALKAGDPSEIADATRAYGESLAQLASRASDKAIKALPASMDDQQKAVLGAKAALEQLDALVAKGWDLPPEVEQYRQQLEGIVAGADGARLAQATLAASLEQVGYAVETIPNTKAVEITAPTDELLAKLEKLGFTVEHLPDGTVRVIPETEKAEKNLGNLSALLAGLDADLAEPEVALNDTAFRNVHASVMNLVRFLDIQRPTPDADLNPASFKGVHATVMGLIGFLDRQNPTPDADLNDGGFRSVFGGVMGNLTTLDGRVANPLAALNDQASNPIRGIMGLLNSLDGMVATATVTTYRDTVIRTLGQASGRPFAADGGALADLPRRPLPRYWVGGAITGRGGPRDDREIVAVSPGEHIFDAHDVALMGGQQAVYAFRAALNSGMIGARSRDAGMRSLVPTVQNSGGGREVSRSVAGFVNNGNVYVTSEREMMRQAEQRKREALAAIGV